MDANSVRIELFPLVTVVTVYEVISVALAWGYATRIRATTYTTPESAKV